MNIKEIKIQLALGLVQKYRLVPWRRDEHGGRMQAIIVWCVKPSILENIRTKILFPGDDKPTSEFFRRLYKGPCHPTYVIVSEEEVIKYENLNS